MATTVQPEATPNDGSLEAASTRLVGLLSDIEDPQPDKKQPEPTPHTEKPSESKLVPAATTDDAKAESGEGEPAEFKPDEKTDDAPPEKPQTFKTRVNGVEVEVTLEEALKGYSRTEDYTRKTQELAEARKKWESDEVQAVRAEREQYAKYLGEFRAALESDTATPPDFEKLKAEHGAEVAASEVAAWHQRTEKLKTIKAEQQRVEEARQADAAKGFAEYRQREQDQLQTKLPDMKDPEKAKVMMSGMVEVARSIGFTPEEINQVTDHRLVLLLHMALRQDQSEKKAQTAKAKIEKALDPAPPGPKKTTEKPNELRAAKQRLRDGGGRVEDAAAAIEHLID